MSETAHLSEAKRALLDKYLRGELPNMTAPGPGAISRHDAAGPAPLSFAQQQLWLVARLIPASPVYNECVTIHLPGPLDAAILEQSFNDVIQRHEAWRTTFTVVDGEPVQIVQPTLTYTLPMLDLRRLPASEREAEAVRLATAEALEPFDLARGPLVRATLMRLDDEDHRLFLTLHHIVFDGVTVYNVLLHELAAIYQARVQGRPSPLPELPIQYADYAHWQRRWLSNGALSDQLAYWTQQLHGAPTTLALPTDRPRPPVQSFRGLMQTFAIPRELTDALRALSRREGVTLFMTLLAVFATLLYRYSGQEDMLIGTVTGGRKRGEVQGLMGYFLNTVVLRADLSENPTFQHLLARVKEVTLGAQAHDDLPFAYLVKELHPERDLSQIPLIQVFMTLEPALAALDSGWSLTQMDVETATSKFDLTLELDDRPDGLIGRFEYSTELFDPATIARMIEHWQTLLASAVADPTRRVSVLPMLTEDERRRLLVEWNETRASYPHDQCAHQLVEAQAARTPEAVAVEFEGERLSYAQLNQRANRLAHHLRALGVAPDVPVGLCLERSPDLVVGLLGILKAGGAYVPLDPAYPTERLAYMLHDTAAPVVVTQRSLLDRLPVAGHRVVCLDADAVRLAHESAADPICPAAPEGLAYINYTSGSTGRPKGVEIPHRALVNLLTAMRQRPGLGATDTLLAVTTVSFDIATLELLLPLITGARLALVSRAVAINGPALAAALARTRATVMQATPATWRLLIETGWRGDPRLRALCGGEALSRALADQLLERCAALWNMYGPTETTIWSTMQPIIANGDAISIGRPIANTDVYILDGQGQPVAAGVPGELYIGGAGLARGYHNRPDLTEERFVPHPFDDAPGARLYRTGDLARYRADGCLEWLARLDSQVKLRGYRVELGEIEAALRRHPAVRECVVVLSGQDASAQRLVAYVVARAEPAPHAVELRRFLKEALPDYMVPSAFVHLAALPLTANGKVDRRALPAPDAAAADATEGVVPPLLTLHHQLVSIWEELLERRPISIRDSFFDIGGHSLLAARMVDRIEQVCGITLPLTALFAHSTIEELTTVLLAPEAAPATPLVELQAGGAKPPFFYLHGDLEGGGFYCAELARSLGSDQPFYALQPHGVDGASVPHTIAAMAADYVTRLRAVRPHGPYVLGGFCAAGFVAYEMAQQLRAQGEAVELLVLVNVLKPHRRAAVGQRVISHCAGYLGVSVEQQLALYLRLRSWDTYVTSFARLDRAIQQKALRELARNMARQLARVKAPARRGGGVLALDTRREQLFGRYGWAVTGYDPRPYPGRAILFWPQDEQAETPDPADPTHGWRALLPRTEVHMTPGTHLTSVTRHVHVLAEHLRDCLAMTM